MRPFRLVQFDPDGPGGDARYSQTKVRATLRRASVWRVLVCADLDLLIVFVDSIQILTTEIVGEPFLLGSSFLGWVV